MQTAFVTASRSIVSGLWFFSKSPMLIFELESLRRFLTSSALSSVVSEVGSKVEDLISTCTLQTSKRKRIQVLVAKNNNDGSLVFDLLGVQASARRSTFFLHHASRSNGPSGALEGIARTPNHQ